MNIDISNANCGRGHSPDHACLRVGFLAIAELSFGALGRRRGRVSTPPSPQVHTRCATVRGTLPKVPADAVALSGARPIRLRQTGGGLVAAFDARSRRLLCLLGRVSLASAAVRVCCYRQRKGLRRPPRRGSRRTPPVSPPSSGVERSDRPRSLKPSLSLFLPLPRSSGGSLLGERALKERRPKTSMST